ncbi:hypothetical protein [Nesterenkonia sp. HG001]|uniref:hypothetical protein n=1 Tax=Nesterenkonia sp. HG001 TaxID=2983207 RepID=UPI002AC51882|nr:hypothetical protein [Nesterenkonia sp. HG001]MDZ5076765.1 hypothetical protein [Nesterenkonia sp. HG001]
MPYERPRPRTRMSGPQALMILLGLLCTLTSLGSLIAWAAGADRFLIVAAITGTVGLLAIVAGAGTAGRTHG